MSGPPAVARPVPLMLNRCSSAIIIGLRISPARWDGMAAGRSEKVGDRRDM